MKPAFTILVAAVLWASPSAFAQADECQNATPISGAGSHSWSFTSQFTDTNFQHLTLCGQRNSLRDVFFQWTATQTGSYRFSTSSGGEGTQLSIYEGSGCGTTCLVEERLGHPQYPFDVTRGVISLQDVQAGETFLLMVGTTTSSTFTAYLEIEHWNDPCLAASSDSFEENDSIRTPAPLIDGVITGLHLNQVDRDYYSACVSPGTTLTVEADFMHAQGNIDIAMYQVIGGWAFDIDGQTRAVGDSLTNGEVVSWTNNTPNNAQITLLVYLNETDLAACQDYSLTVFGSAECGLKYHRVCDPMDPNSTGQPTHLIGYANPNAGSGLSLKCTQGPPEQFGYFLIGSGFSEPGIQVGQGRLCLNVNGANWFARYNEPGERNSLGRFNSAGEFANLVGTGDGGYSFNLPSALPGGSPSNYPFQVFPGTTWYFQLWHREAQGQSNWSNGLGVSF